MTSLESYLRARCPRSQAFQGFCTGINLEKSGVYPAKIGIASLPGSQ
jgi:hypothetical protein